MTTAAGARGTAGLAGGDDLTPAERARRFVEQELIPLEQRAESWAASSPATLVARIKTESVAARLHGGLHAVEHGGQGWSKTEWFLVEEQYGRSTNALSWHIPTAYNVLASGTPRSRSTGGCARRCAASCTTPTRSPRRKRGQTPPASPRARGAPAAAG